MFSHLIALLCLTAAEPSSPALPVPPLPPAAAPPTTTFTGKSFPPPGAPADQAFLGELLSAQASMLDQRAWAITATQRLAAAGHDARLAALEAKQDGDAAARTHQLRGRLTDAWNDVSRVMTAPWLVDGRIGCRPQAIGFEVQMDPRSSPDRRRAAEEAARRCLDRQLSNVRPLQKANAALDAAVREAEAALSGTVAAAVGAPAGAEDRGR